MQSPSPDKFAAGRFSKVKLHFRSIFSDLNKNAKEIFIFQNPFNCAIEELLPVLHLEVIHLQCNDMIKRKHEKKSLMKVYECFDMNMLN